jgi:hypothetical protein
MKSILTEIESVLFIFLERNEAKTFERGDQYCTENTRSGRNASRFNKRKNREKANSTHYSTKHLESKDYLEDCLGFYRKEVRNEGMDLSLSGVGDKCLSYHIGIVFFMSI